MSNAKKALAKATKTRKPTRPTSVPSDASGTYLGELGQEVAPVQLTFGWFGHVVRVNPGAGELELVDFMRKASKLDIGDDLDNADKSVEALEVTLEFLQHQIHPDDWDLFWDLAKTHRQQTSHLMDVAMTIVEKIAAFPTGQPSDSSVGPRSTGPKSPGGSSSLTTKALDLLPGRPDLQAAVIRAQEAMA